MIVSFVIPCYRSEKTIESVCEELILVLMKKPQTDYEIILVNDASPDNVYSVLKRMAKKNPKIKIIDFAKNVGKHAALMAGFRNCIGEYVVCLDDDGQCPVDKLWLLLEPLIGPNDVSMAQYGKKKQSYVKNLGSKMNAWMMTSMLGKPKDFQFANFAAMKKFVVEEIVRYEHSYSYVNGLILRTTKNIVNVPMEERERSVGVGGYTFLKSIKLWLNGYTAFSIMPLRIATIMGLVFAVFGFVLTVVVIIKKLSNPNILEGYTSTMSALLLLSGIIMIMLGILGEYVGRIYMCLNKAPQYVVREKINFGREEEAER